MRIQSFKPIVDQDSELLILGTMPGPEALRRKEYYGYPGNHFWKIMPAIYGEGALKNYEDKLNFLKRNGVALWDVIESCLREGASDQNIRSLKPNDIPNLLRAYPNIKRVFLNGRLAQKLFQKHFKDSVTLPVYYLPSTSPAHAAMSYDKKLEVWRGIVKREKRWC